MMIEIVPADLTHAAAVAGRLRDGDRAEIEGAGLPVDATLAQSVAYSLHAWAGLVDGEVAAVWGIGAASMLSSTGQPWLLTTPTLERAPKRFLRESRRFVGVMLELYPHLENFVDARYGRAIRWLRWLGFTLHDPAPYGALGLPYHRFEMGT